MTNNQADKKVSEKSSHPKTSSRKDKKKKSGKQKVFSIGFMMLSLTIAVMVFFTLFFVGIQIGPYLGI